MLNKAVIVLLLMVSANAAQAQDGWVAVQSGAAGKDLNAVYFADSKRG